MRVFVSIFALAVVCAMSQPSQAAIVNFRLQGNSGFGLLGGNENPAVSGGGSGGEIGTGISLDDATNILSINVGWGSGNGFTNLTGNATAMHIHDAGNALFTSNGGVEIGLNSLAGFNGDLTNGGFMGDITLTSAQSTELLQGRYYINVHTAANGGGEIRGNFVAVPEPSSVGLCALLAGCVGFRRRRQA